MTELSQRASAVLCDTYTRMPVTLVEGAGAWVVTDQGDRLLDGVGGIAVNVLGHGHPALVAAVSAQVARLVHASNLYFTEPQVRLAEMLVASAFPSRVYFSNSGAEANEAAIKIARKWGRTHKSGAHEIVTLTGAFHGRTMATLAATASPRYGEPFQPLPGGFRQVARGDLGALEAALDEQVAAVLLEPVQGESGVFLLPIPYLVAARELCDRHGCLLIVDEVQCGMGRTGRMWAHQWPGIVPDVMTVAKGLGGGLPIGATLAGPRADVFEPGDHGSTFGGNPLACAAAVAVLDVISREGLVENAARVGERVANGGLKRVTMPCYSHGAKSTGDAPPRCCRAASRYPLTLRRWADAGRIEVGWVGREPRFPISAVDALRSDSGESRPSGESRVAGYVRVSGATGQESSFAAQEAELRARFGSRLVAVYKDKGSGLRESRRGLERVLEDAEEGRFEVLAVTHADRLARFGTTWLERLLLRDGVRLEVLHERGRPGACSSCWRTSCRWWPPSPDACTVSSPQRTSAGCSGMRTNTKRWSVYKHRDVLVGTATCSGYRAAEAATGKILPIAELAKRSRWLMDLVAGTAVRLLEEHWSEADLDAIAAGIGPDGRKLPANAYMAMRRLGWRAHPSPGTYLS
ncbi:MAG: aminotransferase class III-fold pyridoxal phosphate-dependent enzyme, partial [Candidatus Dormibacteria bacterium]